jgi:hypothetical protein
MKYLEKDQIDWGKQSKQDARWNTIITCYRDNFKRQTLPAEKQYWTMCGDCSDRGKLRAGSEPDQVVASGLIKPSQFYGVEINPEIAKANKKLTGGFNWIADDFLWAMIKTKKYNPGIVFYDTTSYPTTIVKSFKRIIQFLSEMNIRNVLLIMNTVVLGRMRKIDSQRDILDPIYGDRTANLILQRYEWRVINNIYEYKGTGSSRIKMAVTGFIRF